MKKDIILVKRYTPNKKDTKLWKKRFSVREKMIPGQQILKWLDEEKQMVGWKATDAEMYIAEYINNALDKIAKKVKNYKEKAPRTGFKPPTEKEKKDFGELFEGIKQTLPQSFFNCPKHKKTPLTRIRGKARVCSKCDIK
jgi:hypothetical protein